MQHIFASILPIFLITLIGSIIRRKWLTSEEFWRNLEKLSYFLLFPSMLFNYISTADLGSSSLIKLTIALILSTSVVSISLVIYRKKTDGDKVQFTSIFQGAIRYNSYIFFGLSSALFGNEGLAIVSVVSSYMIIFTNIISVLVFAAYIPSSLAERSKTENILLLGKLMGSNPLIIASLAGFIFNYSGMRLNLGIQNAMISLSNAALAIGMLNVGAGLKFIVCPLHLRQVFFASSIKLLALPLATALILSLMSINSTERAIGILYSSLPCASSAYVMSRQLRGDFESMASIITFTTIFSVVSIAFIMYILG